MNEMILETKGICKRFGRQVVLNQVSLMVPKGCVYGLLGPNGAGKSTLMKMFSGMMRPDEGEIFFRGKPWSRPEFTIALPLKQRLIFEGTAPQTQA